MDAPQTVERALADRSCEGCVCLEAGAGVGNMTAGLLEAGTQSVYAVTNDANHASDVIDRLGGECRVAVQLADLRLLPLPDDSVDFVTAHALFNVVSPSAVTAIVEELTRVTNPGGCLVIDDYSPLPEGSQVRKLFAVENAAAELADSAPSLTFYPASRIRRLLSGYGWQHDRTRSILEPVPWTTELLEAHADVVRDRTEEVPDNLATLLVKRAERLVDEIWAAEVGEMYSVAMTLRE